VSPRGLPPWGFRRRGVPTSRRSDRARRRTGGLSASSASRLGYRTRTRCRADLDQPQREHVVDLGPEGHPQNGWLEGLRPVGQVQPSRTETLRAVNNSSLGTVVCSSRSASSLRRPEPPAEPNAGEPLPARPPDASGTDREAVAGVHRQRRRGRQLQPVGMRHLRTPWHCVPRSRTALDGAEAQLRPRRPVQP
jgi:hypothetical protein